VDYVLLSPKGEATAHLVMQIERKKMLPETWNIFIALPLSPTRFPTSTIISCQLGRASIDNGLAAAAL
jgi:hypothetical protein